MTFGLPNTFDSSRRHLETKQISLIASLRQHPLLLVVRPNLEQLDQGCCSADFLDQLIRVQDAGLRHLEVAWSAHAGWGDLVQHLRSRLDNICIGAASVVSSDAVDCVSQLDLTYAMSPCLDPVLLGRAAQKGTLLVPGVFSPTEVMQAMQLDCRLVKLFPASELGCSYWRRLQAPLGELPFVIAAGGLVPADIRPWLDAGHGAVALGRRVISGHSVDAELLEWLERSTCRL